KNHRGVGAGFLHCVADGVEHGPTLMGRAALARCHATDNRRVIGGRLPGVKRPLAAGQTLDDQAGVLVDEYRHESDSEIRHESKATKTRRHQESPISFVLSCFRGELHQPASCTALSAASSIESAVVKFILLSFSRRLPSSSLVPFMRITI